MFCLFVDKNRFRTEATKKKLVLAGRGGIGGLLCGGLRTAPLLAGCLHGSSRIRRRRWLQRGFSGQCLETERRLSCSAHSSCCVTVPLRPVVATAAARFGNGIKKTPWGPRLCKSSGRGSGLQSQADGITTPTRTRSSTLYICISGSSCYVSPSLSTW